MLPSSAPGLQGHIDMVCEKNGYVAHDFSTDPIKTVVENGWLKAQGTTLGADNGVGEWLRVALVTVGLVVYHDATWGLSK
jgi:dipeptidase D